jgi:two-component system chemotaxis sensor kinase CheA
MNVADESLAELFEQYKDEVKDTIGTLDTALVAIEQDPTNSEVIFAIFRHLHSLKGSSKMFNVDNIGHIAHKLEDLMQIIDQDNSILARHPKIVETLFRGNDIFQDIITRLETDIGFIHLTPEHAGFIEAINQQLEAVKGKGNLLVDCARALLEELEPLIPTLEDVDTERLRHLMKDLSNQVRLVGQEAGGGEITYSYGGKDVTSLVGAYEKGLEKFRSGNFSAEDTAEFFKNAGVMLQVLFEVAEEDIMGLLGELNDGLDMYESKSLEVDAIVIEFLSVLLTDLKEKVRSGGRGPVEAEAPPAAAPVSVDAEDEIAAVVRRAPAAQVKTIRVDEKKIDLFLDSVGKLITQSEILNHLQYSFKGAGMNPALVRDFAALNRTISNDIVNLQKSIMEVRQVEMDNILKKFPRLVRDISHKMGKEVELVISGERIPIDKSLLDDVEQAMIHIVRNAIDHGLELPEEREAAGKLRRGTINIRVVNEEAAVLVEVADDGRGVDFQAVRHRALDRGMVTLEEIESMSEKDIERLIFKSGLTTKEEATDISGRGVGLDVVMSNIRKWNGEVTVESTPGQGLTIKLLIPITNTLLTKEAILLKLGQSMFCLPLEHVVEIVTVPPERLHRHREQTLFQHRNQVINVVDIKQLLGMVDGWEEGRDRTFIILRGKTNDRKAIGTDELLGQQKIVIKDFEIEAFRRMPYYHGLTLMGDGRVVLVLDAEEIVD